MRADDGGKRRAVVVVTMTMISIETRTIMFSLVLGILVAFHRDISVAQRESNFFMRVLFRFMPTFRLLSPLQAL